MLSIFWRQWLDFEGVFYQGSTFRCSLDTHKLPVLTCNKENKHYGCLRVVLLQQSFCVLALMDRSQGQVHGSEGKFLIICLPPSLSHVNHNLPIGLLSSMCWTASRAAGHCPNSQQKRGPQRAQFLVCLANLLACKPYKTSIH